MKTKQAVYPLLLSGMLAFCTSLPAADYVIDTQGSHAFIQFKIPHLGYSWLLGRFNTFEGSFTYDDKQPTNANVEVTINTASIDSNHAERDKHLRGEKFLDTGKYPEARFVSTSFQEDKDGHGTLQGDLTLKGITRPITIAVKPIGAGMDPWGGYRRGFEGQAQLTLKDFAIDADSLGPASKVVELGLYVEGIRQNKPAGRIKR